MKFCDIEPLVYEWLEFFHGNDCSSEEICAYINVSLGTQYKTTQLVKMLDYHINKGHISIKRNKAFNHVCYSL